LLKRIVSDRSEISRYTHIILDEVNFNSFNFLNNKKLLLEVHEREIDMDFVLLIIKLLRIQGLKIKIVLMSATCDAQLFTEYFAKKLENGEKIQLKSINCPFNMFSVKEYYLDDIDKICNGVGIKHFNKEKEISLLKLLIKGNSKNTQG
jgi:HrpA-like RNA helicase